VSEKVNFDYFWCYKRSKTTKTRLNHPYGPVIRDFL
jgi:hypothetical protein